MTAETDSESTNTVIEESSSGRKWLIAIILGILFMLFANPVTVGILSAISTLLGGMSLSLNQPFTTILLGVLFIFVVRILLW
jgi:hypothetical protein